MGGRDRRRVEARRPPARAGRGAARPASCAPLASSATTGSLVGRAPRPARGARPLLDADQPLAHALAQLAGRHPREGDQQQPLERRCPRRRSAPPARRSCTSCRCRRWPRARSPRSGSGPQTSNWLGSEPRRCSSRAHLLAAPAARPTAGGPAPEPGRLGRRPSRRRARRVAARSRAARRASARRRARAGARARASSRSKLARRSSTPARRPAPRIAARAAAASAYAAEVVAEERQRLAHARGRTGRPAPPAAPARSPRAALGVVGQRRDPAIAHVVAARRRGRPSTAANGRSGWVGGRARAAGPRRRAGAWRRPASRSSRSSTSPLHARRPCRSAAGRRASATRTSSGSPALRVADQRARPAPRSRRRSGRPRR